jgi:hypothetical protein
LEIRASGRSGGDFEPSPNPPLPPSDAPSEKPPVKSAPVNCQTFGTNVEFVSRPPLAARLARQDQKLLYVLHLSGNFENDRFT